MNQIDNVMGRAWKFEVKVSKFEATGYAFTVARLRVSGRVYCFRRQTEVGGC